MMENKNEIVELLKDLRAPFPSPDDGLILQDYGSALCERIDKALASLQSDEREEMEWLPMETAPRDGTVIQLLVCKDELPDCIDGEEEGELSRTIGVNGFDNDGEDNWHVVGWSWTHDCFTDVASGINPVAWLPLAPLPTNCEHGNGLTDYCEPCGRIHNA